MQPDPIERLRSALADTPRNLDFLAEYVSELERQRNEEDIFRPLAFRDAYFGGAETGPLVLSVFSELYEPLSAGDKIEIRRWWHEKAHREAHHYDDLRMRLVLAISFVDLIH